MSQDVTQWLAEIKSLQQQLAQVQQELDAAYASTDHWRVLYNTEAQQRRTEAKLNEQIIESLRAEIEQLHEGQKSLGREAGTRGAIEQELAQMGVEQLQAKLVELIIEGDRAREEADRLGEELKVEKANHAQTRKSLTTALGDTVDLLTKERAGRQPGAHPAGGAQVPGTVKNPLPQLPPLGQAPPPA